MTDYRNQIGIRIDSSAINVEICQSFNFSVLIVVFV
jgi:hypothetical protein